MINNLFLSFEALWPKILHPDLKLFVHFFLLTLYILFSNTNPVTFISTQYCTYNRKLRVLT